MRPSHRRSKTMAHARRRRPPCSPPHAAASARAAPAAAPLCLKSWTWTWTIVAVIAVVAVASSCSSSAFVPPASRPSRGPGIGGAPRAGRGGCIGIGGIGGGACSTEESSLNPSSSRRRSNLYGRRIPAFLAAVPADDVLDDDDDDDDLPPPPPQAFDDDDDLYDMTLTRSAAERMTVPQLKQQLRLRGKKVSGRKSELVDRLLNVVPPRGTSSGGDGERRSAVVGGDEGPGQGEPGEEGPVDVSAYLDESDRGKHFKSSTDLNGKDSDRSQSSDNDSDDYDTANGEKQKRSDSSPYKAEIWGDEARIVEDYEGRSLVVDGLSRTVIEYKGHGRKNSNKVQAYVSASRDALRLYLAGGDGTANATDSPAAEVRRMQEEREKQSRVQPRDFNDVDLPDTGDEAGHYKHVLDRDYGDWGPYSPTGAQVSARQVRGALFLSDVRGPFHPDARALVDKIAFECQPVVVMAPDLFRGRPWEEDPDGAAGFNAEGESYEEWRATHPDGRVNVDVRAAAAVLRRRYGVSSVAVFGTCYGGGRALEAAAGWQPPPPRAEEDEVLGAGDEGGRGIPAAPPPPVDPSACVAWYPTRYDAAELFGPAAGDRRLQNGKGEIGSPDAAAPAPAPDSPPSSSSVAVMAIFAGEDTIPGARPEDAERLKNLLEADQRVNDRMVKVFRNQEHGFAHVGMGRGLEDDDGGYGGGAEEEQQGKSFLEEEFGGAGGSLSMDSGDAEVACLLSTAWMETYSRPFLPTTGVAVKDDEDQSWSELEMKDLAAANERDVRKELEDAVRNHEAVPPDLRRMPSYQYGNEIDAMENMGGDLPVAEEAGRPAWDEKLIEAEEDLKRIGVEPDDDDETFMSKIEEAHKAGRLQSWLGDIDMENPPEVPKSSNRAGTMGYDEDFTEKFADAMAEFERVGLSKDDDLSTMARKIKGALDRGDLRGLQELRADRARRKAARKDEDAAKRAATMEKIGVTEDDDLDTTYKKLKQAIDRGDFDELRDEVAPQGDMGGGSSAGQLWEDEDEGLW